MKNLKHKIDDQISGHETNQTDTKIWYQVSAQVRYQIGERVDELIWSQINFKLINQM